MKLEIISPGKKVFEGNARMVNFPGADGSFGVLDNHAPLIAVLKAGKIEITEENNNKIDVVISGGVVEVLKNTVSALVEQ